MDSDNELLLQQPDAAHLPMPPDTTPTSTMDPFCSTTRGPPLSPCKDQSLAPFSLRSFQLSYGILKFKASVYTVALF